MLRYILKRLVLAIFVLWAVITATFFLMAAAPGNPFSSDQTNSEQVEKLMKKYGYDKPASERYINYLKGLVQVDFSALNDGNPETDFLTFDFKESTMKRDQPVIDLIAEGFPVSITIGISSMLIAFILGSIIGSIAAFYQNKWPDYALMLFVMVGVSVPTFVIAPLLIHIGRGFIPFVGGMTPQRYIPPIIVLAIPYTAMVTRIMRGSLIEVLNSNFVRTAYAKGVPTRQVLSKHTIKAALLPVVSFMGPTIAALVTGSLVMEKIFTLPGLGRYFVDGALNRDQHMVLGCVIVYSLMVTVANLIVDILYGFLDPRIRVGN